MAVFEKTIILCRPETSMNIGAVCRAMANTGLSDLRIVGKKTDYNEADIFKLALHAGYILRNARFFPPSIEGLKKAGSDCSALAGTSRRSGQKRGAVWMTPEQLCAQREKFYGGRLGIVFGNERTGLTDEEISVCTFFVNIPADDNFGSYNLSHAVLIISYLLYAAENNNNFVKPPFRKKADLNCIRNASQEICAYLTRMGMFKAGGKTENENFFTKLLSSAGASEFDTGHLTGIFKKIFYIKTAQPESFI